MALNKEVFKTRTLTALIFVAVMLVGLLWNRWSFILLFTIIHFGCWYEFVKLMKKIYGEKYFPYSLLGMIYISLPIAMLINLRLDNIIYKGDMVFADFGYIEPCGIIFSIWINDTMAYIVGSLIGRTPFSKISPKKTWEGTAGGALLCVIIMSLIGYLVTNEFYNWAIIAAICAIFGTAGDLLESKIKRMADVKDSGTIMPGHGGFLDRFDSLLVATPFVWLYIKLFV
jgi:phosphatidate cytidylyltransferase